MAGELLNHARGEAENASSVLDALAAALDRLVGAHDDARRRLLDYAAAARSGACLGLRAAVARLAGIDPAEAVGDARRIALWIDVYNALVIHAVIARRTTTSVRGEADFFDGPHYCIDGRKRTLDVIEHGLLRRNRRKYLGVSPVLARGDPRRCGSPGRVDPRLHFALYSASRSSPALRRMRPEGLDAGLDAAAREYLAGDVYLDGRRIVLPAVFRWYARDSGRTPAAIAGFVAGHLPADDLRRRALAAADAGERLDYAPFDWTLNDRHGPAALP